MPTHHDSFSLGNITINEFSFIKNNDFSVPKDSRKSSLAQKIGTGYVEVDSGRKVYLRVQLTSLIEDQELFSMEAELESTVIAEDFEQVPLKNIIGIMYSYLRPLVAQMTIFSKLPPLDLPPVNFSDFEVPELGKNSED